MSRNHSCRFLLLCLALLAPATDVFAAPNATITTTSVRLRRSYPTFGISTLYKFRLEPSESLAIIPKDARVEVSAKKIVAGKQEWFETLYVSRTSQLKGWVYSGLVGNRRFIRLDPGVEARLPNVTRNVSGDGVEFPRLALIDLLTDSAYAQESGQVANDEHDTDPLRTLLLGAGYVVLFIGSVFAAKKWIFKKGNTYAFLTGLCVLLILGLLSEKAFSDILANFLAK